MVFPAVNGKGAVNAKMYDWRSENHSSPAYLKRNRCWRWGANIRVQE